MAIRPAESRACPGLSVRSNIRLRSTFATRSEGLPDGRASRYRGRAATRRPGKPACRLPAACRHFRRGHGGRRRGAVALAAVPGDARFARSRGDQPPLCRGRPLSQRFRRVLPPVYERSSARPSGAWLPSPCSAASVAPIRMGRALRQWASFSAPSCWRRWVLPTAYGGGQARPRRSTCPAALIAGNPEFLRPLVGVAPPGGALSALLRGRTSDAGAGRHAGGCWATAPRRLPAPASCWRAGLALTARPFSEALSRHPGRAPGAVLPDVPIGALLLSTPARSASVPPAHARGR